MADIFTPEKRSYVMSRIRSKNTKIERTMKRILEKNNIPFREHPKSYGNPDFIVGSNVALFCDGSFWHGFKYEEKKKPGKKFWRDKIEGNMRRDRRISRKLRRNGMSVLRFWEQEIVEKRSEIIARKILRYASIKNRSRR